MKAEESRGKKRIAMENNVKQCKAMESNGKQRKGKIKGKKSYKSELLLREEKIKPERILKKKYRNWHCSGEEKIFSERCDEDGFKLKFEFGSFKDEKAILLSGTIFSICQNHYIVCLRLVQKSQVSLAGKLFFLLSLSCPKTVFKLS